MTFTISPGHDWRYLTKEVGTGRENYYLQGTAQGEPAGIWQGRGAEQLGLTGEVDEQDMEALYGHFIDPRDPAFRSRDGWAEAAKLGRAPRRYASPEDILAKKLVAEPQATPERVEQLRAQAQKEARQAVSFLDLTFSPPKSVSVLHTSLRAQELAAQRAGDAAGAELWGRRAHLVEQAIWAGNNAGLGYWAEHAGFSRAGYHGRRDPDGASVGRYVDGHEWIAPGFFQHTSRAGDPQLHIHNPVLNRVQNPDGKWRTLDSRAMHRVRPAAAAIAERVMFEQLSRDLGVSVAQRPDGQALEVTTVPQEARDLFATRRRAITEGVATRVEAFERRFGRAPTALELSRLSQAETLESRPAKSAEVPTMEEELDRWSAQLRTEVDLSMAEVATRSVGRVDAAEAAKPFRPGYVVQQALARVQAKKTVWTRHDLIRAINDELPGCLGGLSADHVGGLLTELADQAIRPEPDVPESGQEVIRLTAPDLVPAPEEYRRADGRSQFEAPTSDVYATADQLRREERLARAASQSGAPQVPAEQVDSVLAEAAEGGRALGADQAAAVRGVLTSGRRVEVLIGLAGSGKSYTVSTLAQAWEAHVGGRVFGVGPSERAVNVLREEGLRRSLNFARWLDRQERIDERRATVGEQEWQLRAGDLVVVDEAGMMGMDVLDRIRARVEAAGAKLLAAGDDRQLPAVGAGGGFRLLRQHARTYELVEVRRMTAEWEREASARLRAHDPEVVPVYERHGRLVDGGTGEEAAEAAGRAWLGATLRGKRALLMVDTNRQAADLSDRLRAELVDLGRVEDGGERIGYREDEYGERLWAVAGVGDVIETRRNEWGITDADGRAVLNHNLYSVVGRPGDGALDVRQITYDDGQEQLGPVVTLPAAYLEEHATLGYAVTVHSGQGATVQASFPVVTQSTGAAALYVGMTRGTEENTAFVETLRVGELEPDAEHDDDRRRTPAAVVAGILERDEPARPAVEVEQANLEHAGSLVNLGAQWTTAVEDLTRARYGAFADRLVEEGKLTAEQRGQLESDEAAGPFWRLLRSAELAGHDPAELFEQAIAARELGSAGSVARVLHHRLTGELDGRLVATADTFADRTPQVESPVGEWARELAEAMEARVGQLGERAVAEVPEWAERRLGPVPDDPLERMEWADRAGRVAAYREQYLDEPDSVDAIGPCPPVGAAEARAGWYAAWRALGEPEERRAEAELAVEQLRARVDAYAREEAWAPDWVGEELQATAAARRVHDTEAALLHARARAETDPERRAALVTQASSHRALAQELDQAGQLLEQVDEARGKWYLGTAEARARAEGARAELERRGITPERADADDAAEAKASAPEDVEQRPAEAVDVDAATVEPAADQEVDGADARAAAEPVAEAVQEPAERGARARTVERAPVWAATGLQRPAGVPSPSDVATKVQRAREAVQTLAERERVEQEAARQRERELAADVDRQRRAEAAEASRPVLVRSAAAAESRPGAPGSGASLRESQGSAPAAGPGGGEPVDGA